MKRTFQPSNLVRKRLSRLSLRAWQPKRGSQDHQCADRAQGPQRADSRRQRSQAVPMTRQKLDPIGITLVGIHSLAVFVVSCTTASNTQCFNQRQ